MPVKVYGAWTVEIRPTKAGSTRNAFRTVAANLDEAHGWIRDAIWIFDRAVAEHVTTPKVKRIKGGGKELTFRTQTFGWLCRLNPVKGAWQETSDDNFDIIDPI